MEQDLDTSRNAAGYECRLGCKEKDIVDVNVGICSFCPPPVSQVLKLLGEERTVRQQVSCSGKIPQKESALASLVPLQC